MSSCSLNEDVSAVELATVAPEHPSPISVLDASFYQDDMPPSPVSKAPSVFKGKEMVSVLFFCLLFFFIATRRIIICEVLHLDMVTMYAFFALYETMAGNLSLW